MVACVTILGCLIMRTHLKTNGSESGNSSYFSGAVLFAAFSIVILSLMFSCAAVVTNIITISGAIDKATASVSSPPVAAAAPVRLTQVVAATTRKMSERKPAVKVRKTS